MRKSASLRFSSIGMVCGLLGVVACGPPPSTETPPLLPRSSSPPPSASPGPLPEPTPSLSSQPSPLSNLTPSSSPSSSPSPTPKPSVPATPVFEMRFEEPKRFLYSKGETVRIYVTLLDAQGQPLSSQVQATLPIEWRSTRPQEIAVDQPGLYSITG